MNTYLFVKVSDLESKSMYTYLLMKVSDVGIMCFIILIKNTTTPYQRI
jgi:hypothetical protein